MKKLAALTLVLFLMVGFMSPLPTKAAEGKPTVIQIEGGEHHAIALTSEGKVIAWGRNNFGQLGNTSVSSHTLDPLYVEGLDNVIKISAGENYNLALKSDGTVYAWGENDYGQLGNGNTIDQSLPVVVSGLSNVTQIEASVFNSAAIKSDGTLWVWGGNMQGQLGDGTYDDSHTPIQIYSLANVVDVALGTYHSLAVLDDGTLYAWGHNLHGTLGDGSQTSRNSPKIVESSITDIGAGHSHSFAFYHLFSETIATGKNSHGELGIGNTDSPKLDWGLVSAFSGQRFAHLDGGFYHSAALRTDGTAFTWGGNFNGQLGNGTTTSTSIPEIVASGVQYISAGFNNTYVILNDGTAKACGNNTYGMAGDGTTTDRTSFVTIDVVPDSVPPVVTLYGDNPAIVPQYTSFIDPGATATDDVDGDVSSSIVRTGTWHTTIPGAYTVTYTATDSSGNSSSVDRTIVVDAVPQITLIGENLVEINVGDAFTDPGATAIDSEDGDLTPSIVTNGTVDTSIPGMYSIDYSVTDSAGTTTTETRDVNVRDNIAPVITLNGDSSITHEAGTTFNDPGATATDNIDGDISESINVSFFDELMLGEQILTYDVTDSSGNNTSVQRTVNVVDTQAPVITLNDSNPLEIEVGTGFSDPGAVAQDSFDGMQNITGTGTVDPNTLGTYILTYEATDNAGNIATPVERTVNVVDTTPPHVLVNGDIDIIVEWCSTYTELGATATDSHEGDLTASVTTSGTVNTSALGDYPITYEASDSSGNIGSATRTVRVVDSEFPVITLIDGDITVEVGETFADPGATALDNYDGNLTNQITSTSHVVNTWPGTYSIQYKVTDSSGNESIVQRQVQVVDTTPPEITLNGDNPMDIDINSSWNDPMATSTDYTDGEQGSILGTGMVDTSTIGEYTITYEWTDAFGNTGTATRIVNVTDLPPSITLNGDNSIILEANSDSYTEEGAKANDFVDGDLTPSIVIDGTVDNSVIGTYDIEYSVTDSFGNTTTEIRQVVVRDSVDPIVTLHGERAITIEAGSTYADAGATASDNYDGDLTASIVTVIYRGKGEKLDAVDTSVLARYEISYRSEDSSGNRGSDYRNVTVVDTTPPEITVVGGTSQSIYRGENFTDQGATAIDNLDDDISANITSTGSVDTSTNGAYTITYSITDSEGNTATATREVTVRDRPSPSPRPSRRNDDDDDEVTNEEAVTKDEVIELDADLFVSGSEDAGDKELVSKVEAKLSKNELSEDSLRVSVKKEIIEEITSKKKDEGKKKAELVIREVKDKDIKEYNMDIPKDSLAVLTQDEMQFSVSTPVGGIELPKETISKLSEGDQPLAVKIKQLNFIDNYKHTRKVKQAHAKAKVISRALEINSDYEGLTKIKLPWDKDIEHNMIEKVAVFVEHNEGDTEILEATLINDKEGKPEFVEAYIDRFSSFSIITIPKEEEEPLVEESKPTVKELTKRVKLSIGSKEIDNDGEVEEMDVKPFIQKKVARTLAPVRFISEALGYGVNWKPTTQQVVIQGEKRLTLTIDSRKVIVDDEEIEIDCKAIIKEGRTFVPLRFISEEMGSAVHWNPNNQSITIVKKYIVQPE